MLMTHCFYFFIFFVLFLGDCYPSPPLITQHNLSHINLIQLSYVALSIISILSNCLKIICNRVRYVRFDINLNLYNKKKSMFRPQGKWSHLPHILLGLIFMSEYEGFQVIFLLIYSELNLWSPLVTVFKFKKNTSMILFVISSIYSFMDAVTSFSHFFCFIIFQRISSSYVDTTSSWFPGLLILLSNDTEKNPGPQYENCFFNFMTWNLNSLVKNNFERVQLIEAHNVLFNYDLISINL